MTNQQRNHEKLRLIISIILLGGLIVMGAVGPRLTFFYCPNDKWAFIIPLRGGEYTSYIQNFTCPYCRETFAVLTYWDGTTYIDQRYGVVP